MKLSTFSGQGHPLISLPREKACHRCEEVKPFTEFYVVESYTDHLSRVCKPCNTIDTREREYRRRLKRKGREEMEKRIAHHRMLANLMESILLEN